MNDPLSPGVQSTSGMNGFTPYNRAEMLAGAYGNGNAQSNYGQVPGQETMVYMGKGYKRDGASTGMLPVSVAAKEYWSFSPEEQAKWADYAMATMKFIPGDANAEGIYGNFLSGLAQYQATTGQKVDPFQFMEMRKQLFIKSGQAGGRGGGAGGGVGPRAVVNLTNPQDAEVLVDNALTQYLGRQADPEELQAFLKVLNRQERKNPVVVSRSGQTGGVNPQLIAQEFAAAQPEAAETQAATTYMSWMVDALNAPTTGGVESGL